MVAMFGMDDVDKVEPVVVQTDGKDTVASPQAPKTVTDEADGLIRGDRQKDYGHPAINFQRIAMGWNAYLLKRPKTADGEPEPLRPHDVANLMTILKAVRNAEGYKRDTTVDIIGYAALDSIVSGDDEL
jgi:hypothetical protein